MPTATAWEDVAASRAPGRPGVRQVLAAGGVELLELSGSTQGETGPGTVLALARVGAVPCVLVGQDRDVATLGPGDLRVARRGIALAQELGLPLVTVVDTPGGELSAAAEEGGLAGQIAACLYDLAGTTVPTLCVLLGQGTGGAALALTTADRVLAARHAWLSPLPPEGASVIVHRTVEKAADMAVAQRVGCASLLADGVVDRVVDERPDAAAEPDAFARRLLAAVEDELLALLAAPAEQRLAARAQPRGLGRRGPQRGQPQAVTASRAARPSPATATPTRSTRAGARRATTGPSRPPTRKPSASGSTADQRTARAARSRGRRRCWTRRAARSSQRSRARSSRGCSQQQAEHHHAGRRPEVAAVDADERDARRQARAGDRSRPRRELVGPRSAAAAARSPRR